MTSFRAVNLLLLAIFVTIGVGLVGFVGARLGGYPAAAPIFGMVLQVGVVAFLGLLAIGSSVGLVHTWQWFSRTVLGRRPQT